VQTLKEMSTTELLTYAQELGIANVASLRKQEIEYGNTRVTSPTDGIIISVGVSHGEAVTINTEEATVFFVIGEDITKMEGSLEVDEGNIGQIEIGQLANFCVDTYPGRHFAGKLTRVNFASTTKNGTKFYNAKLDVDNSRCLLRPGMTINAEIKVAEAKDSLAVTGQVFQIDGELLKEIAELLGYEFHPILDEQKKRLKNELGQLQTKYLWVLKNKSFIEKAVKIDVTDEIYFEIKSGLSGDDNIVTDIDEPDKMRASVYQQAKQKYPPEDGWIISVARPGSINFQLLKALIGKIVITVKGGHVENVKCPDWLDVKINDLDTTDEEE